MEFGRAVVKVFIERNRAINLVEGDFIAQGGEGRLYGQGDLAYKIYLDPNRMIPPTKLDELSVLERANIVRPRDRLHDRDGRVVGFTMCRVENAVGLPRLFTNDYRDRFGIAAESTVRLVREMAHTIEYIHSHGILMVDGNEFNYLVDSNHYATPYFIDVDSYQTPGYPATAIMASVRDWTRADFSRATDWFSFAVVAFQLFVGIHPFKGRHPDFKKGDFAGRVRAGMSVFNKSVTLPASTRGLEQIPLRYRDWLEAVFEHGERSRPPGEPGQVTPAKPLRPVIGTRTLRVEILRSLNEDIRGAWSGGSVLMLRTDNHVYVGTEKYACRRGEHFVLPSCRRPLGFSLHHGRVSLRDLNTGTILPTPLAGSELFTVGNRVYLIRGENLCEIRVLEVGGKMVVAPGPQWKVLPNAARVYDGVIMQDVLGKMHAVIPFRGAATAITHMRQLDGRRLLTCKYERGVLVAAAANRGGGYDHFLFRFNEAHDEYDLIRTRDTDPPVNFTVLDSGVGMRIIDDGELQVFSSRRGAKTWDVIRESAVKTGWSLFNHGGRAAFYAGRKVYRLSQG